MPFKYAQIRILGVVTIILGSIFLTIVSCVSDPTFNVYYENVAVFLGISDTQVAAYILDHPKLGHAVCYGLLAGICFVTFNKSYFIAFIIPFGIGLALEVSQHYAATRSPRVADVIVNVQGIGLMLFTFFLWQQLRHNSPQEPTPLSKKHTQFLEFYRSALPWQESKKTQTSCNWQELIQYLFSHKVFIFTWPTLHKIYKQEIPNSIIKHSDAIRQKNTLHSLLLASELVKTISLFEQNDIRVVPFKGPELATRLYKDLNSRMYTDLDILVPTHEVGKAFSLLISQQYVPEINLTVKQLSHYIKHEDNISLTHPIHHVHIELHWELSARYLHIPFDHSFVKTRLHERELKGVSIQCLGNEDLLIYFCLHGTKHGWAQLEHMDCIARLLFKKPQLDWALVQNLAKQLKCEKMLSLGLALTQQHTHITLPNHIVCNLNSDKTIQRLLSTSTQNLQFTHENIGQTKDLRFSTLRFAIRDNLIDKLRYLCRTLCIPSKTQWKIQNIPHSFHILYYALRPLMIGWEICKGSLLGKWTKL